VLRGEIHSSKRAGRNLMSFHSAYLSEQLTSRGRASAAELAPAASVAVARVGLTDTGVVDKVLHFLLVM